MKKPKPPCATCGRPSIARSLCQACYQRQRRRGNGDASPAKPPLGLYEETLRLDAAMAVRAEADGVSVAEAWREAARRWLGVAP